MMNIQKSVALSLAMGAMAAAIAQTETHEGPVERFQTGPPVLDSTSNVFPQINEGNTQRPVNPVNPSKPNMVLPGSPNTIRPGGVRRSTVPQTLARFPGMDDNGSAPPDPEIAVGPNHVVQVVNTAIAFFSKTGTKTFQQDLGNTGFFGTVGAGSFVFDPRVFYDQIAQRWFVLALDVNFSTNDESHLLLAVSDDNDPNGTWAKYRISNLLTVNGQLCWADYPMAGYNKDGLVVSYNMFRFSGSSVGAQFQVIPKADLLNNGRPTVSSFYERDSFSAQPAFTMDAAVDRVFMTEAWTLSSLRLWAVGDVAGSPTLQSADVQVPPFSVNIGLLRSRSGGQLDPVAIRLMNSVYRAKKLATTHTIAVSDSDSRGMIRWYEFDVRNWPLSGTPTLTQSGNIRGRAGENYLMPDIFSNKYGSMAVVFTRCSDTIAADMMVATRKRTDSPGSFGTPTMLATSRGVYSGYARWGDYHATVTDPADDSTFWSVAQMIPQNARGFFDWSTEIQKYTVADESGGSEEIVPIEARVFVGNLKAGGLDQVRNADGNTMSVNSVFQNKVGDVAGIEVTFRVDRPASQVSSLSVIGLATTNVNAEATGMIWIYNWNGRRYEHLRSFRLSTIAGDQIRVNIASNVGRYINSSGQVKAVMRGLVPARRSGVRTYSLDVDQMQLLAVFTG